MSYHDSDGSSRSQPDEEAHRVDVARTGATKVDAGVSMLVHRFFATCEDARCGWCADDNEILWSILRLIEAGLTMLDDVGVRSYQRAT